MYLIDSGSRAEVNLGGAAVEAGDAFVPQPVQHVGVVAIAEERLGVGADDLAVQVRNNRDLVLAPHRGQHCSDLRVTERGIQVQCPISRRRSQAPSRRVLNRLQAGDLRQPFHGLLMYVGRDSRRRERRRQDRDLVAGNSLGCRSIPSRRHTGAAWFGTVHDHAASISHSPDTCPRIDPPNYARESQIPASGSAASPRGSSPNALTAERSPQNAAIRMLTFGAWTHSNREATRVRDGGRYLVVGVSQPSNRSLRLAVQHGNVALLGCHRRVSLMHRGLAEPAVVPSAVISPFCH